MALSARLPLAVDRYGACVRTVLIRGLDLTGVTMAAQVRLRPDTPGDPLVDLDTVETASAEGLYFVSAATGEDGVTVSTVQIRINETTLEGLPYAGELGDASTFAWDWQATISADKRRLAYGDFTVLPGVTGADDAPSDRTASYAPRSSAATWSTAQLTFGPETVEITIDGADALAPLIKQSTDAAAQTAADRVAAALSAATAESAAGPTYASQALGEAATTEGQSFAVDNGDGTVTVYLRTSGGSTAQRTLATTDFLASPAGAAATGAADGNTVQQNLNRLAHAEVSAFLNSEDAPVGVDTVYRAGPYAYKEAGESATDYHLETAGGVKLYVMPENGKLPIGAFGADLSGGTSSYTPLTKAIAAGRPISLSGQLQTTGRLDVTTDNLILDGGNDAVINKNHGSYGLYIGPVGVALGNADAASTISAVKIAGASWATNEHEGKWVLITDTSPCARRIVSNTADTLTLNYALDLSPVGKAATLYTPLKNIVLRNLAIQSLGVGTDSANIVIQYVDNVIIENVQSLSSHGNCLSIYRCRNVRINGGNFSHSSTFGLFVYDCDDVVATSVTADYNDDDYALQFKDCRNARMSVCTANYNTNWACNIKSSGLNPTFNCHIESCTTSFNGGIGGSILSSANEGTTYVARNFSVDNHKSYRDGQGVAVEVDSGAGLENAAVTNPLVAEAALAGIGLLAIAPLTASNMALALTNPRVIRSASQAIYCDMPNVDVNGGRLQDNNWNGSVNPEIKMDANAVNCTIRATRLIHTSTASKSTRPVQEFSGADHNLYVDMEYDDSGAAYGQTDMILTGTASRALSNTPRVLPTTQVRPQIVQMVPVVSADIGDAAKSVYPGMERTQVYNTPITADRAISFQTGAFNGATFRVVRTAAATGAFSVNIRSVTTVLKALTAGTWADVTYNGTAWAVTASGSL